MLHCAEKICLRKEVVTGVTVCVQRSGEDNPQGSGWSVGGQTWQQGPFLTEPSH